MSVRWITGVVVPVLLLIGIGILRRIWRGRSETELSVRWAATGFAILLLIALTNIVRVPPSHVIDVGLYHSYSTQILEGKVPYLDFNLEYPPLALVPMVAAKVLSLPFGGGLPAFATCFGIVIALLSWGIAVLLRRITPMTGSGSPADVAYSYVPLVIVLTPLLSWRFDLFPALLTLLAFLAVLRGGPSTAGLWLGAGIAAKLYPLLLVPVFGLFYLARREISSILRLGIGVGIAVALLMLPPALLAQEGFLRFLKYHELRGIELGSLPAGFLGLGQSLSLTQVGLIQNYGATHLQGRVADGVVQVLPFVSVAALLLLLLLGYRRFRLESVDTGDVSPGSLLTLLLAVLLTSLATSKVLSPQFVVWLLPFAPLLHRGARRAYLLIAALSALIYPTLWHRIQAFELGPLLVLNARNVLIVGLAVWLVMSGWPTAVSLGVSATGRNPSQDSGADLNWST